MTETHIGFLYNAASSIPNDSNQTTSIIKSNFLMRCKEISKGYSLPEKHFSSKVRCRHCCLEWSRGTTIKLNSSKLTRRQRKRIRNLKEHKHNKEFIKSKKELLNSKTFDILCPFCKKTTKIICKKTERKVSKDILVKPVETKSQVSKLKLENNKLRETQKKTELNVYCKTREVFSLKNKNNTIATQEKSKVIKNNKNKKNKFAGLCQNAVLAAAKFKEESINKNKLSLFLKPST